ncbi:MAG: glycosyltransferase family 4 protein [Armatimonadetes bacterium]|nr:glycosyltransferase family 4 protein [Armatimonadota bacterium]
MPKVLLVAHWDWVLYNFRLPLAKALREKGYDVVFVCPFGKYVSKLAIEGFRCIHWSVIRESLNPIREIIAVFHLTQIYRHERPHLVHHFTVKPNLYGSLATKLVVGKNVSEKLRAINTFTGLGFLFSYHPTAKLLRTILLPFMRIVMKSNKIWTVCQNDSDKETLLQKGLVIPERLTIIASSGVDTTRFHPDGVFFRDPMDGQATIVLMASRLLWDKGVGEFVEAAKLLKRKSVGVEFWLAGTPDGGNPMCVSEEIVKQWHENGLIKWLGHCDDMPNLLRKVDIAVLPSYYHEGVPRFLLEAAASGLPIVATDIEGCRMVVRHGENGFLVPVRNSQALADAIERLVCDHQLRLRMGKVSREIAVKEFDERKILEQWLRLYEQVLAS